MFRIPRKDVLTLEDLPPKTSNSCCVVRYGAIGDMIIASSIFPEIKKQGYKLYVNTTPKGMDIIRNDPYVDEFIIQDDKQIPNHNLYDYWDMLETRFDKFVNLSESIEGGLLLTPERVMNTGGRIYNIPADPDYFKPQEYVHEKYNINYTEQTHKIAQVPFSNNAKFYPTKSERKWAEKERKKFKYKTVVMVALSGSSTHKVYPHMDSVIAQTMIRTKDVCFVLVGESLCQILEAGWEQEKRVYRRSGEYTIRQTLALLDQVDIVIGPETGVLNAASNMKMRKVILLSHSSVENLTKHWKNTLAISANIPCHPCHRMHIGKKYCNTHPENGAAMCAWEIDPQIISDEIIKVSRK